MINKKYRICCLLSLFLPILSATVYAGTFIENLDSMGIDIATFSKNKSISRYETARLLNAANCEDCIQAPDWMKQTYSREFRDNFKKIDGKYFEDINYESAIWNNKSYYYCVAYVGENGYMAGYPITSSKCKGKFCGQDPVTSPEFYNIVFNVIQDEIRGKYIIDRGQAKTWLKKLKSSSLQMKVLTQTDIDIIKNSEDKKDYAKTNEEFQAWMKYCMYNLSQCGFQPFGIIGTGYWPVSELNILYKEGIITYDEAKNIAKYENVDGETALHVFSTVRDNYKNCVTNTDYDCDGIENGRDNCPYEYNPSQYDLDEDGAGNVCDDDIDGDNKKNKIGIVDDNNNIVISLWDNKLDTTPLGNQSRGFTFFINVDSISRTSPTTVKVTPLTNGNIDSIELDRGDGNIQKSRNGNSISHIFQSPGTYTLKAIAKSKEGYESFAMNKIFIAQESSEKYALNILPNFIFKNGKIDYTFSPLYSGNIDKIVRNVNDTQEEAKKPTESFKISLQEDGIYVINAKGYKNNELKSLAMLTINQDGAPHFASMSVIPGSIGENTTIKTNLIGLSENNVDYIDINRGNETTNSLETEHNYIYNSVGIKAVQQKVSLKNGNILYAISTFFVENSLLNQSHAINITGNRLVYNPNEKLSLRLNIYPKSPVLSLYTNYFAGQKNYVLNPDESDMAINRSYPSAGNMILTNSVMINKCVSLLNQGTVHINSVDVCENALKNKTLSKYKCDMDKDGIPDICDDDIDGDGKKNLLGIITKENADCSINSQNINYEIFRKEFGVCSLDNCPFQINSDQSDLNNNGIGEACDSNSLQLLGYSNFSEDSHNALSLNSKDRDQDGIPDSIDQCPDVPGNLINGCIDLDFNSCRTSSKCGNGQIDEGETCLNCPMDAGVCCGNGKLEKRENCETCPEDAGVCGQCGNGKIDKGETCKNCPEDVGECTAFCGNGEIEAAETCENCEKDVGECSATCGNGKIEPAETCENCKKDVKQCKKETCGDGKVDAEAGEECDAGKENGRNKECTKMCTKYDPKKPDCGNGEIDKGEDCKTCPVDLGDKCVKEGDKPYCGNGKIEKWETCRNCPEDVGECTAFCGNGEIEAAETCENCEKDVGECSATCGNGKIEPAETCENCKKDVKQCKKETCGDGKVDAEAGEECDAGKENGRNKECTKMCTKYDPKKPDCGNGEIDKGEDCKTCPVDLGDKCVKEGDKPYCGNGKIEKWETCRNCPEDVGECTAFCGNGEIEAAETCENCEKDVGECSATCGNGKIEPAETCENCKKDVKQCKKETCGDGKVDAEAGEECDAGKENGRNKECTKMCTKYDPKKPDCGNGKIDKGEDCKTCPVDLGDKCVKEGDKPYCGNGKIEKWETCRNCPEDVGECTAFCGNGEIEAAETCENCEKDVGECSATCGNGKIEPAETCENCKKDVKQCKKETCGDGKVDAEAGEECDAGKENGRNKECTKMCTKYDPKKPDCGNGEIDKGEDCKTCPVDLGDKCVKEGDKLECGNGVLDKGEECDFNDKKKTNWGKYGCSTSCHVINSSIVKCNSEYDGKVLSDLSESNHLCLLGIAKSFSFNADKWTWSCSIGNDSIGCSAKKTICGDKVGSEGENCGTCPDDVKNPCIDDGEGECQCNECPERLGSLCDGGRTGNDCQCDECPDKLGSLCDGGGTDNDCQCDECPDKLGSLCDGGGGDDGYEEEDGDEGICGNGKKDEGETCDNCPGDMGWCIKNDNCNSCPCEYSDYMSDLTRGDIIRAKLWDKNEMAFYNYSNVVDLENFINLR